MLSRERNFVERYHNLFKQFVYNGQSSCCVYPIAEARLTNIKMFETKVNTYSNPTKKRQNRKVNYNFCQIITYYSILSDKCRKCCK